MAILDEIIHTMSKEEIRSFKIFMLRIKTGKERRVLQLFDVIRAHRDKNLSAGELTLKLPGSPDANLCYQLKKRLRDYIDRHAADFISANQFNQALQYLALGRFHTSKGNLHIGMDYLEKAASRARSNQWNDLLEMILSETIQLTREIPELNPSAIIEERVALRKKQIALKELDEVLVLLGYQLRLSQQTGRGTLKYNETLEQILERYRDDSFYLSDPTFRLRVIEGVSQLFLEQHAFAAMASYLSQQIPLVVQANLFTRQNHELKCKLLTWYTNALFKADRIEDSIKVAALLKLAMDEFGAMLADKYFIFYNSALVYANTRINLPEAIHILEETIRNPALDKHPLYSLVVQLNLVLCYYESGLFEKASKRLARLYIHPAYGLADPYFKVKIGITDVILKVTLDRWDAALPRIRQVQKDFEPHLNEESTYEKIISFLGIMLSIARRDGDLTASLNQKIADWLELYKNQEAETEVIQYYNWLQSWYAKHTLR